VRISFRLIFSLVIGITLLSFLFAMFQVKAEKRSLRKELENRAAILAESLEEKATPLLYFHSHKRLQALADQFGNREHMEGIAVYDKAGEKLAATPTVEDSGTSELPSVIQSIAGNSPIAEFKTLNGKPSHVYILPLHEDGKVVGALALFHDVSFIKAQTTRLWWDTFLSVLAQAVFIVLVTLLIVHWSIVGPVARMTKWMKEIRTGKGAGRSSLEGEDLFQPLAQEVKHLATSLTAARAAAEAEARLRETAEAVWTPERLRAHVRSKLGDRPFFVVSNREPYMHTYRGKDLEVSVPASGLVTAIEPILRACQGVWLAHGSGDADRETVNEHDCLRVPPDDPQYTLKRVWLSKEEEEGYYFGFANEGIWPLCHIAHTRPVFRATDWEHYQAVNRKFADALLEEMEGVEEPGVLVQDYHFALLPQLIKEKVPGARVAIFWHIPWPNAEAFAICPWQREILKGLLGADLVGFHVQSHCNNFLETVDRALESRVNWERFTVERSGHLTQVRPFPISVACPDSAEPDQMQPGSSYLDRAALLKEHGIEATFMGIGVERVDYTKGILERLRALERFFEKYPMFVGQFTFVQIGAPSRTHIKRYHELLGEVESESERINWRFQTNRWKPILYLQRHHNHQEINRYYKAADLCMVTSLHDGMNLVAKEYVAACESNQGVLILSCFTGASRELRDAVIVNPYDTEQLADAIHFALVMDPEYRADHMRRMRRIVKEFNVYRWAAELITELCEIRLEAHAEVTEKYVR
jgi:trehalose 6-phosphate synthase